ncbi:MAG: hypothetical protein H7Y11_05435, partial [Armatimonadetes bacterium]|nr:hypothetical protein [Anaerolineae bacterium]
MIYTLARLLEKYLKLPMEQTMPLIIRGAVVTAVVLFLLLATGIVAFDQLLPGQATLAGLRLGDVASQDVYAPETLTYVSQVLTEQRRADAQASVQPLYNAADLSVARTQTRLAEQILEYIAVVRRDAYASVPQRTQDIHAITALVLDEQTTEQLLALPEASWEGVRNEVVQLLEQVMQES